MATLPISGAARGTWAGDLETWLLSGHNPDGGHDDQLWSGTWIDIRNYDDLAAAVTAIGATETTLLIPNAQTVDENVTVPATMKLQFVGQGQLTINTGIDLTIYRPENIIAPKRRQIFACSGTGEVIFTKSGLVYPQWWGALGDGTGDDQPEIQAAVTSLATPGGVVCLLPGNYKVDSVIMLASYVNLIGTDPETCVLESSGHHGLHAETKIHIIVADIGIDGNRGADTSTTGNIALFFHDCTHCDIFNCYIYEYLGQGVGVGGVASPGESSYVRTLNCRIWNCNDNAIDYNASQEGAIQGNWCYDNENAGIFVGHGNTFHNLIADNHCNGNGIDGIILDGSNYASEGAVAILNILRGNICYNNQRHGIQLLGAESNIVLGNVCTNNGQGGGASGGIVLTNDVQAQPCQFNTVSDNICLDTQGSPTQDYGIWETGNAEYNVISGGRCAGNSAAQVSSVGTYTQTYAINGYDQTGQKGMLFRKGIQVKRAIANVSSPPTDAELDTAFGTPADVGDAFIAIIDDNNAHTDERLVWSDGSNWWHVQGTKAL